MFETKYLPKRNMFDALVGSFSLKKTRNRIKFIIHYPKVFKKPLKKCLENWHGLNFVLAILCILNLIPFKV
jgi:hypothetical protein